METYNITFKGYRRDTNAGSLPTYSGVYLIYRCRYNQDTQKVILLELFYIGQSQNLNNEINHHKRRDEFLRQAKENEQICYSYARVEENSLNIVENALIYMQKPRLNEKLKDNYNYEEAEFHIDGACFMLKKTDFVIQ